MFFFLFLAALVLFQYGQAYFRRRAEARRAEIISARLGSAWYASVLDEENVAVLKQLYWWYLIKDKFKVKENINNNLSNSMLLLHLLLQDWLNTHKEGGKSLNDT